MSACMSQVQHTYADYQRELVAAAAVQSAMSAGAPTLMTGLAPQSKSTQPRPVNDTPMSSRVIYFRTTTGGRLS